MKFVVKITFRGLVDYIGNGSYRVNKEKYAVLVGDESKAKRYTTYHHAKRAYEMLKETCVNLDGDVEFVQVDTEGAKDESSIDVNSAQVV